MEIAFITSVSVIVANPPESRKLYIDALGLALEGDEDGYFYSDKIEGSKHFGVWPLSEAAKSCFGTSEWPDKHPIPQASIEFEVQNSEAVLAAAHELQGKGFQLLHDVKEEPWGQTIVRVQSADGAIVGISYAPSLHE